MKIAYSKTGKRKNLKCDRSSSRYTNKNIAGRTDMNGEEDTLTDEKVGNEKWLTWMKVGERMGCHQRWDRSFFYKGMQFPVCARCTGVFLAYILTMLSYILVSIHSHLRKCRNVFYSKGSLILALIGCLVMLVDWSVQALRIKESTNVRRAITGSLGGAGLLIFYIRLIRKVINVLFHRN